MLRSGVGFWLKWSDIGMGLLSLHSAVAFSRLLFSGLMQSISSLRRLEHRVRHLRVPNKLELVKSEMSDLQANRI